MGECTMCSFWGQNDRAKQAMWHNTKRIPHNTTSYALGTKLMALAETNYVSHRETVKKQIHHGKMFLHFPGDKTYLVWMFHMDTESQFLQDPSLSFYHLILQGNVILIQY